MNRTQVFFRIFISKLNTCFLKIKCEIYKKLKREKRKGENMLCYICGCWKMCLKCQFIIDILIIFFLYLILFFIYLKIYIYIYKYAYIYISKIRNLYKNQTFY